MRQHKFDFSFMAKIDELDDQTGQYRGMIIKVL